MSFEAYDIQKCWSQIYGMLDSNWLLQPRVSPWILSSIILVSCSILPLPFLPMIIPYLTKHWISRRTKFPILLLCHSWRWNRKHKTLLILTQSVIFQWVFRIPFSFAGSLVTWIDCPSTHFMSQRMGWTEGNTVSGSVIGIWCLRLGVWLHLGNRKKDHWMCLPLAISKEGFFSQADSIQTEMERTGGFTNLANRILWIVGGRFGAWIRGQNPSSGWETPGKLSWCEMSHSYLMAQVIRRKLRDST